MNTLGERLKAARSEAGLTQTQLASEIGVSQNAIQKIEKGGETKYIIQLAKVLDVSAEWLQFGTGEMKATEAEDEEEIVIDVLDHAASAGYGAYNGDMVEIVRQLRYVPEQFHQLFRGMNPEKIRVVSAKGDSMQPTIDHGDLLFLDISINYFDGDGIYVFNYGDYNYVKRLQKAGRTLRVISDNSELYAKWELEGEEADSIYIIGKVRAVQNQRLSFIG